MVERKLSDEASRAYWEKVEAVAKEVKALPNWMKGGPGDSPSKSSKNEPAPGKSKGKS